MRKTLLLACFLVVISPLIVSAKVPKDTLNLNVFAVVSENIENAALDVSHDLKARTGYESFPLKGYQVHCTLYMTRYKKDKYPEILAVVKKIANSTSSFELKTGGLHLTKGNWLFLNLIKSKELQELANVLAIELAPKRYIDNYIPKWVNDYPDKKENIAKYGSPNVFEQFEPHLTLLPGNKNTEPLCRFVLQSVSKDYGKCIKGKVIGIGIGNAPKFGQIKKADKIFLFDR